MLLYGDSKFDSNKNTRLLNAAIKYVIDSGRFTFSLTNIGTSLSSFLILFYFYYFFQNMTELFITLSSPVFIYLYLTQIQYNLCLIERAESINDFSLKSLLLCLFIVIALASCRVKVRVFASYFVLY